MKEHAGDIDFAVQPELLSLLSSGDFGRYANAQGDMNVCFISNNDITGGNSGSAMFNAKGELLGLAFDGNWEAMSSDIVFEPDLQRCIGVDVRYMLFIIEKYGKAAHLIQELKWVDEVNIPMKPHFYRFNIITITAAIISAIPIPMLVVKASPKRKIPTHTAVTGSIAPNTEVSVEPMLFTALTRARLETTVGIKANRIKLPAVCHSLMG